MANFMLSVGNQNLPIEHLKRGSLRDAAYAFSAQYAEKLQSLNCERHHYEPLLFLELKGKKVALKGAGFCCPDFGNTVTQLVGLPESFTSSVSVAKFSSVENP